MAINTAQWGYYLRIPIEYIPSEATNGQMLQLTESVIEKLPGALQDYFWQSVKNGGGDIRLCERDDGTEQVPIHVTTCDVVSKRLRVRYRLPVFNGSNILHLFFNSDGATVLPQANAFGQFSAWQDFEAVYLFDGPSPLLDATVNERHLTSIGSAIFDGETVNSGGIFANRLVAADYEGVTGNSSRTVTFTANPGAGEYVGAVSWGGNNTAERWSLYFNGGAFRVEIEDSFEYSSAWQPDGQLHRFTSILDGSTFPDDHRFLIDGNEILNTTSGVSRTVATAAANDVIINGFDNFLTAQYGGKKMGELTIRSHAITNAMDETESANATNPDDFYGTPTLYQDGKLMRVFSGGVNIQTLSSGDCQKHAIVTGQTTVNTVIESTFYKKLSAIARCIFKTTITGEFTKHAPLSGGVAGKIHTTGIFNKTSVLQGWVNIRARITSRFYNKANNIEPPTITIKGVLRENIEIKGFINNND